MRRDPVKTACKLTLGYGRRALFADLTIGVAAAAPTSARAAL